MKILGMDVRLEENNDGWIVAECPNLPGCVSQGRTVNEALLNVQEAIIGRHMAEAMKQYLSQPEG